MAIGRLKSFPSKLKYGANIFRKETTLNGRQQAQSMTSNVHATYNYNPSPSVYQKTRMSDQTFSASILYLKMRHPFRQAHHTHNTSPAKNFLAHIPRMRPSKITRYWKTSTCLYDCIRVYTHCICYKLFDPNVRKVLQLGVCS